MIKVATIVILCMSSVVIAAQNNYWQDFPFEDTAVVASRATEEKFAHFLLKVFQLSPVEQKSAVKELYIEAVRGETIRYFIALAEKYLYEPNSPYRHEDLYLSFLQLLAQDGFLPMEDTEHYRQQYVMIQKNRVGMPATDFGFVLPNGVKGHLYDIQSNYTVLFFNDPACNDCRQVKQLLSVAPECAFSMGVTILALYIDADTALWHRTTYPTEWINAYTSEMVEQQLYDVRALPTLYLLDNVKRVLLKDVSPEQLINYLHRKAYVNQ